MGIAGTSGWQTILVLIMLFCGTGLAQIESVAPLPPSPGINDQAAAGMQTSLEQQRAALDAFREKLQAGSLHDQHASVAKQVEPLRLQSGADAAATTAPASNGLSKEAKAPQSSTFFTFPWPGTLPLSMPNVQVTTDSCDALASTEVNKLVQTAASKHGLSAD